MNPVLTQLPKAQEAYMATLQNWTEVDTNELLLAANTAINAAIAKGILCVNLGNISDTRQAEKAAIELQEIGYRAVVVSGGHSQQPDGSFKALTAIHINWKMMPENTRDGYTT
jgi:hydroxymethylpyrimidine/phosphomethylpyrimidine kinase